MSENANIAEAVKDELNAQTWAQDFTAERSYVPILELEELAGLHVTVVPAAWPTELGTRAANYSEEFKLDVAIQKHVASDAVDQIDPNVALAEAIANHFRGKPLPGITPPAICIASGLEPLYIPEHLIKYQVVSSILRLTFKRAR